MTCHAPAQAFGAGGEFDDVRAEIAALRARKSRLCQIIEQRLPEPDRAGCRSPIATSFR